MGKRRLGNGMQTCLCVIKKEVVLAATGRQLGWRAPAALCWQRGQQGTRPVLPFEPAGSSGGGGKLSGRANRGGGHLLLLLGSGGRGGGGGGGKRGALRLDVRGGEHKQEVAGGGEQPSHEGEGGAAAESREAGGERLGGRL